MRKFLLISVFGCALLLRLYKLDTRPVGFTPDEAAFGYNAYSILQTGKDEWGNPWYQLWWKNLRSFGDYKLPLYSFAAIPSIKLFGLNEFSTRLPNAVLGSLAVVAIYLLGSALFSYRVGFISATMLALSPWHISLSRGAFEANLVTLFIPLAIYAYLRGKQYLSVIFLALSFYSYHTGRFIAPLFFLLLPVFYSKTIKVKKGFVILAFVLFLPGLIGMFLGSNLRAADVSIFSPTDNWQGLSSRRFAVRNSGLSDIIARFVYNKPVDVASRFLSNYLSYFSPQFLFSHGASESTYGMIMNRGVMLYPQLIFLIGYILVLVKRPSRKLLFLTVLLLVSGIPAALAKSPGFAANRAISLLPFLTIASAFGADYILNSIHRFRSLIISSVTALFVFSFLSFLVDYFYYSPYVMAKSMHFGWRETLNRALPISDQYSRVLVSRSLSEPHIYLAFYTSYDPGLYQQSTRDWDRLFKAKRVKYLDQIDGYFLGKFRFGDIYPAAHLNYQVMYIGSPSDFPEKYPEYFHIDYPDSQPAIVVATNTIK